VIRLDFIFQMVDEVTKKTLSNIPLLRTKASPRDGEQWRQRFKEELQALIQVRTLFLHRDEPMISFE
jgi:ufm1-conjugating enzyme 1